MIKHKLFDKAFTIVELIVVIVVIGILAAVGIVSYSRVQANARDTRRSVSISNISNALESYYQKNGEYPSCNMMSGTASNVAGGILSGLPADSLSAPTAASGTNSIQAACADLVGSADLFSYIGDSSSNCITGASCSRYLLKYREDTTGNIVTIKSRYGIDKSFAVTWGGVDGEKASAVTKTSDGGYIIGGETSSFGLGGNDAYVSKFDSAGKLSWSKTFGGTGQEYTGAIIETKDGGFATTGSINSTGAGIFDCYLNKYTSDGTLSWTRTWGGTDDDRPYALIQTSDGGYAIGGYTVSYDVWNGDAFLAKFNSIGDLSWSRVFGDGGIDYINGIIEESDGSYFIVGDSSSYGAGDYDAFVSKINKSGSILWFKTLGGTGVDAYKALVKLSDGYIAGGYTTSYGSGDKDVLLTKYKSNGDVVWSKIYGGSSEDMVQSMTANSDDSFTVTGSTWSYGAGNLDIFIAKHTRDGDSMWMNTFGGPNHDRGWGIIQTSDAGFAVSGFTWMNTAGSYDSILLKYASDGAIINCSATMCKTMSPVKSNISPVLNSYMPVNSAPNVTIGTPLITARPQNATSNVIVSL